MQIITLITALPGAVAQGLIWGIMAIGVYITFRILDIADLTVDGTMCTGGAVCIMMMLSGHNVWISMLAATLAGMLAGLVTGIFHTFMGIPAILAGILTQLSLYSVNLKIMGKANQAINVDKYNLLVSLRHIKNASLSKNTIFIVAVMCILLLPFSTGSLEQSLAVPFAQPDVTQICHAPRVSTQTGIKFSDL